MRRTGAAESNRQPATGREANGNASRPSPLALVSGAVAGADLESVTATASEALGRPLAIAIPALGEPVVHPVGALAEEQATEINAYAVACVNGTAVSAPALVGDAVPIRIGEQMVGIAIDVRMVTEPGAPGELGAAEQRAWLEAAAAAASVAALMHDVQEGLDGDRRAELLVELSAAPPEDLGEFLNRARRMGCELASGATAICAEAGVQGPGSAPIPSPEGVLLADTGRGFLLGLVPSDSSCRAEDLAAELRSLGFTVAISGPRREPDAFHDALREARLLVQLALTSDVGLGDQDTYRLLIGVLLRDRDELILLRDRTISPLADYDARHDTEFLSTLQAFLAHDGSTTETAEAMQLHRHTVGYRLSRVHEISGLSPYESDGRERLGLGLKSDQILAASAACGVGTDGQA